MHLSCCSFQQYTPKPINPIVNAEKLAGKISNDARFQQYLIANGYSAQRLPLSEWNLEDLTYCALYFHPSLEVSRAQWRAAQVAETNAGQRGQPTVNTNIAHSDDPDPAKKPFALGLSIDIPIETANKRTIRIENAQHLSQIAKLEIAQAAWQLRHAIAQTLAEYQFNQQQIRLLTAEALRRQEIVNIYQKRLSLGAASNIELSNANLQLQTVTSTLHAAQQNQLVLRARLASNLGLPLAQVEAMRLIDHSRPDNNKPFIADMPAAALQTTALLNRLDIRIALEKYAAAESKLKLELAKQYPDLVISPGYTFEFGDNIWSLGISSLLTLLQKNKGGIAEATQLREVEAAQFEALQSKVILDANIANAELKQAQLALENQQRIFVQQQSSTQRMARKLAAGEIDRLELAFAQLEDINAEKNVVLASFQLNQSSVQLENVLQKPIAVNGLSDSEMSDTKIIIEGEK
ncbi:MAG: TolC family protein [Methylotenera sp.]